MRNAAHAKRYRIGKKGTAANPKAQETIDAVNSIAASAEEPASVVDQDPPPSNPNPPEKATPVSEPTVGLKAGYVWT